MNGQIFTSGGLVGTGGGSGTDASFNVIDEFLDGSGVTFIADVSVNTRLSAPDICANRINPIDGSLVFTDDISVNGNIYFTDSIYQNGVLFEGGSVGPTGPTGSAEINLFTIFDNSNASGTIAGLTGPTGTTPWISSFPTELKAGTVLFHNIKASGYIAPYTKFTWPETLTVGYYGVQQQTRQIAILGMEPLKLWISNTRSIVWESTKRRPIQ